MDDQHRGFVVHLNEYPDDLELKSAVIGADPAELGLAAGSDADCRRVVAHHMSDPRSADTVLPTRLRQLQPHGLSVQQNPDLFNVGLLLPRRVRAGSRLSKRGAHLLRRVWIVGSSLCRMLPG